MMNQMPTNSHYVHQPYLTEADIMAIEQEARQEFPDDYALQQVRISKKILAMEAQQLGMSYFDYHHYLTQQRHPTAEV